MKHKITDALIITLIVIGTIVSLVNVSCLRDFSNGVVCCAGWVYAIAILLEDIK